ncbi:hypothetical protein [Amycolatopsis sp. lyj-109]|uniref:hypothetical protein n=1 Tax=Amycolatopsis sp. lyj-109 TaxID=2789287 RepID=UPI003978FFA3
MSLLDRLRTRTSTASEVAVSESGAALVFHAPAGMTAEARSLAASAAPEAGHDLVVADLPEGSPSSTWAAFAAKVPDSDRAIRLVVTGPFRQSGWSMGEWLSGHLGRTVVASEGPVLAAANGGLFVQAHRSGGWCRFAPGQAPAREGSRHPRPGWESQAVATVVPIGSDSGAEPLPAGVWLRADGDPRWLAVSRARLTRTLLCRPDVLTVVLNGQHMPELDLAGVGRFWARLPADVRARACFVHYGPVRLSGGTSLGRVLADLLGEEVRLYAGVPAGTADAPQVFTIRPDGSHGWNTFVQLFGYRPGRFGAPDRLAHRAPVPGLPEIAPGVYRYAPDVVLEVVPAGLWVRPAETPGDPEGVRGLPPDTKEPRLFYGAGGSAPASRMLGLAQEVRERLDYQTRLATGLRPVGAQAGHRELPREVGASPEPGAADHASEVTARLSVPSLPSLGRLLGTEAFVLPSRAAPKMAATKAAPKVAAVRAEIAEPVPADRPGERAQPVPDEGAAAIPGTDLSADRAWLREAWRSAFDTEAGSMMDILARHPRLAGESPVEDALADLVAARLYLAGRTTDLDRALRTGPAGPDVRLGRCVAAGLGRLPSHHGSTTTTLAPTPWQWEFCRAHPVLAEWGFLNVLTEPGAGEGDTDLLIWSATGRLTGVLESGEGPGRVVFLPGTRFKVLATAEPSPDARGRIFLRELPTREIDAEGRAIANRVSVDRLAEAKLRQAADKADKAGEPGGAVPAVLAAKLGLLPGVVSPR